MDNRYQTYDASIIKPIKEIRFDVLGTDEIRAMSAMAGTHGIEVPELFDKQEPKRGGLIDLRMGGSGNSICATCQFDGKFCDGHSAHIDLAEPVFHPLFLQYVKNILDCICIGCSNLLVSKDTEKFKQILKIKSKRNRFIKIHEMCGKAKFCTRPQQNCGMRVSKIKVEIKKKTADINIYSEIDNTDADDKNALDKKKQKIDLTPDMITEIFDNISDEDCMIMGIDPERSRPSDMIHKVFLVPPTALRPSLRGFFSGGSTMEDSLTHKLADIIKENTRFNKHKEKDTDNSFKYAKVHAHLLQYHVITYYDPSIITIPKADGKSAQFKPLTERFKGKGGRIRGNLMGKRGNFNARTVITSDPTISSNYLGVPVQIAMNVTFPEYVSAYNYDALTKLVRNGSDIYPGANYVFRGNNVSGRAVKPIYLKFRKEKIVLQYGDRVERHLQDGDIVLLNRQPTLHKQSMMGHRIKVIDNKDLLTFRLSPAITKPYNADFDGDEMNIFVPQSIQTKIELEEITDVKKQIITPSKSVTIYGIVQDGLSGSYNLTDEKIRINWRDTMNILSYTTFDDFAKLEKNREYSGAELFSMIVPPKITIKVGKPGESNYVDIEDGKLLGGRISNTMLGAGKKKNILQYIWDEYGADAIRNFIDNIQRLTNNFNLWNGFTVGIGDAQIEPKLKKDIVSYIENIMNKVDIDITNIENNPSYMNTHILDNKLYGDTNVVRDDVSTIVMKNVPKTNGFGVMIWSGAKGSPNNLGQIAGAVGMQAFEGGMMPKMYYDRTLCYFHENDDRAKSRGLCYNSYMDGLTYSEFCFHTKTGRAGLIEQVVKTSETGYAQRKLIKTMEDVMIKYDGTVRIANNEIIQQTYGGNGNDTTKQYEYKIQMIEMNNEQFEKVFKFTSEEMKDISDFNKSDNDKIYTNIKHMRDTVRKNSRKANLNYMTTNNAFLFPVNITRIMTSLLKQNSAKKEKLSPKYIIDSIDRLVNINSTPLVKISYKQQKNPPKVAVDDDAIAKTLFKTAMYDALHPKAVIEKYKLSRENFDEIIREIEKTFKNNIIEAGEMVGIIAAQSLGEAVTQMTLNAFHHSGISSLTHSTVGVPRINELISATKNQKTPQMFIFLNNQNRESREIAHNIGSYIEKTTLGSISSKLDIYYDANPSKGGFMEMDNMTEPFYSKKLTRNSCQASIDNLPWLIRIEIDKEKMLDKEVSLMDIKMKFCMWWNRRHSNNKKKKETINVLKKITSFAMLSNSDNDAQPVIHIRCNVKDLDNEERKSNRGSAKFNRATLEDFADMITKFKLKGVEGIDAVNTIAKERYVDANDGDGMHIGEEYVVYTSGVNLKNIRYIKGVNPYRTYSDDVLGMFNAFGIEFARNRLISEFMKAYENAGNTGINAQHISILADIMCYGGSVISADRHGMKKANVDTLAKASFEKPVDVFVSAAVFGDTDKMQSVSSRLYVGSVFKGGTGYPELVLDVNKIQNSEYVEKDEKDRTDAFIGKTFTDAIMEDEGEADDIFIPE
jgi:DNA-directed RNA polymerase II subunit RPB1